MPDETPPPQSCLHNVHRVGDGRRPEPEPTDLCRNALGVFHMFDCPLTLGIPCAYYESSPVPHATTSDVDIEATREELSREFLGWRYRRRVRWLTKPKNLVPVGIVVDGPPEAEEVVPEHLPMRAPPPDAVAAPGMPTPTEATADGAPTTAEPVTASIDPSAPAKPSAPERYPGQRRSEERLAKKRARLAALDAAAAAKAAQIAAVAANPPADDGFGEDIDDATEDDGEEGDDFGEDEVDAIEPVDTGPKTVEQVLAALPDAPIVMPERRGGGQGQQRGGRGGRGGRQGGPRGGGGPPRGPGGGGGGGGGQGGPPGGGGPGGPRRRRRRGRRGGGPGPGGPRGPGGGQGGGGQSPQQRPPA